MNLSNWRTYFVTQASLSDDRTTLDIVRAAVDGGVDAVQLREKETSARSRYELGLELRELTAEAGVDLLVNDRVDIARAIDADGVHVGQSDLSVGVARDLLGSDAIVGCSASTVAEAGEADADGADYLGVGAVYGLPRRTSTRTRTESVRSESPRSPTRSRSRSSASAASRPTTLGRSSRRARPAWP